MLTNRGFTLIELLIVIAILAILAVGIFFIINPLEKIAQSRDTLRKAGIVKLSTALTNYDINHSGYPGNSYSFMNVLVSDGDLKTELPGIAHTPGCLGGVYGQNYYCYESISPNVYVMIPLESQVERDKCATGNPYFMWDSKQGKIGVVCVTSSWRLGSYTFYQ